MCGKDTDIDDYPDSKLRCRDNKCEKVEMPRSFFSLFLLSYSLIQYGSMSLPLKHRS